MTGTTLQDGQAELPTPNATKSYWHRQPSQLLLGHRTTKHLPHEADVVIIGSGITGTFAARELCRNETQRKVVMLEAREACSGATGRNGGHCQPYLYNKSIGIAHFELDTFRYIDNLITSHGIACDWKIVGGVHPFKSRQLLDAVKSRMKRVAAKDPKLAAQVHIVEDLSVLKAMRVEGAVGAVYQPNAAKCWPYKLIAWILENLLTAENAVADEDKRFNLQTNTPATFLQRLDDDSWIVHTPRGQVAAKQVLIATNGYTSHLMPRMARLIVPVRGQISALARPARSVQLQHSYGWPDHGGGDNYLIHRDLDTDDGGPLIFGGERKMADGQELGVSRDDEVNEKIVKALRRGISGVLRLKESADEEEEEELKPEWEWTGIMGYSQDERPWVGAVPESLGGGPGLWISAGYTGHGMPVAARTGMAVAQMIMGKSKGEEAIDLPEEYRISEERIANSKCVREMSLVEELETMDR